MMLFEESVEKAKYPEWLMRKIRQAMGKDAKDTTVDEEINRLTPDEALDYVCNYEGLIDYSREIKNWVECIYNVKL